MKRSSRKLLITILSIVAVMSVVLVSVSLYQYNDEIKKEVQQYIFTSQVEEYRETVRSYAVEYDVEDYLDILLAMMMQESGGRGNDPMQASESLCGEIGCIDDPEQSIEQGVLYFAKTLEAANGDVELAVQSYNFGIGFVHYVQERQSGYNQEIAIQFSQEMYQKAEDKSIYSCLREEAKQYDACYGDIFYARDVMEYKQKFVSK